MPEHRKPLWLVPVRLGPGCRTVGYACQPAKTAADAEALVRARRAAGWEPELVWGPAPEDPRAISTYEAGEE